MRAGYWRATLKMLQARIESGADTLATTSGNVELERVLNAQWEDSSDAIRAFAMIRGGGTLEVDIANALVRCRNTAGEVLDLGIVFHELADHLVLRTTEAWTLSPVCDLDPDLPRKPGVLDD